MRCTVYDRAYLCTCTGGCSFLVQEKGREEKRREGKGREEKRRNAIGFLNS